MLDPDVILESVIDLQEENITVTELEKSKKKVYKELTIHGTQIDVIKKGIQIEEVLKKELQKEDNLPSSFYVVNVGTIVEKWLEWGSNLPRVTPFYAMKSNPDINIVRALHAFGGGFDCASRSELEEVLSVGVSPDKIIFANPCKGLEHIKFAKEHNIFLMTFDSIDEVKKIQKIFPTAHLVLRLLVDDRHSLMPFGTKFGANRKEAMSLIDGCKELGMNLVGVSFHVGSGCLSCDAFTDAIKLAKETFNYANKTGFQLSLLDIGGGWPGVNDGPLLFEEIAREVAPLIDSLFPPSVRVIAEPGRFFCTQCYTLAVTVNSRRERWVASGTTMPQNCVTQPNGVGTTHKSHDSANNSKPGSPSKDDEEKSNDAEKSDESQPGADPEPPPPRKEVLYYLSDGVYGSFNNIVFDHAQPRPKILVAKEDKTTQTEKSCLFGPTCDSIDVICKDVELPTLEIGDWLYFLNMGAYTVASASSFNGFRPPNAKYFMIM
jgi:ornithine decarboxylase